MDKSKIFLRRLVMHYFDINKCAFETHKNPWQKSSFECLLGSKRSDIFRAS